MPSITLNQLTYHYDVAGDGPSLLLLHGFTGSMVNWARHLPIFAQHWRTLTLDLPGHGRSAAPANPDRYRMEAVAADLALLLEQLGAAPVDLLGYSMGGRFALYFALHYPDYVNKLVLESSSPGLATAVARTQRRERDEKLAQFIEREGIEAFVDYWESLPLWTSQEQVAQADQDELRQQRLRNRPRGLANSLRGMGTGAQPSLWPRLPELAAPVLLLAGELDEKFVGINRRMAAQMPDAQLEIVAEAGHTIHFERPQAFTTHVIEFLHNHRPR